MRIAIGYFQCLTSWGIISSFFLVSTFMPVVLFSSKDTIMPGIHPFGVQAMSLAKTLAMTEHVF
jgi:hypothetical protein